MRIAPICLLLWFATTAFGQEQRSNTPSADPHAEHHQHGIEADEHAGHRSNNEKTDSERAHVPPDPPSLVLGEMSNERMIDLMQMEDDAPLGTVRIHEIEAFRADDDNGIAWNVDAWYGGDYHKLWLKTEGERIHNDSAARAELLLDRIVTAWWSVQAGVRHDFLEGSSRTWAALGVQGLAPHLLDIEATFYLGEGGRTAVRIGSERDFLITQRLVLQPQIELNAYGKDDLANGIGSGVSDIELGLRLRYELIREVAPYVGMQWQRTFGQTRSLQRAAGADPSEMSLVAGLKIWF
jgi:copper resistance protein B